MSSANVTDKKTTQLLWLLKISSQIFSISQREAYPFLLKLRFNGVETFVDEKNDNIHTYIHTYIHTSARTK